MIIIKKSYLNYKKRYDIMKKKYTTPTIKKAGKLQDCIVQTHSQGL